MNDRAALHFARWFFTVLLIGRVGAQLIVVRRAGCRRADIADVDAGRPGARLPRQNDVQNSAMLFVVACLAIPASGSAQIVVPAAPPPEPPATFRLFKEAPPEPTRDWFGSIASPNWWEPPASGSDIPRWKIGHTVQVKAPGGVGLSAGFFGRRGDPMPLYLSEGFVLPAHTSVRGPGTYRLQWDAKLGVTVPVVTRPQLKISANAELFLPLTPTAATPQPSSTFLTGGTRLFKLVTKF